MEDVSDYKVVRRGQIVYNPYVIWEGAVHALQRYDAGLVSPVYPVWGTIDPIADPWFVDHLLRMPAAISAYNRFASGAVNRRRSIRRADFLSIEIPLPPLSEQRAIAGVLSTIQRSIEATERVVEAARQLKRSLMRHLFTYGPVPLAEVENVPLKETEIGRVPEHWEVARLEDVVDGTQYGLSMRGSAEGNHPILRMNNLEDGSVTTRELQYVDLNESEFEKFKLKQGDILFNRTNSHELVGKAAIFDLDGDYVFASYLVRILPRSGGASSRYLNHLLNWEATQARLKGIASRAVSQSNISASKLRAFTVPLPPVSEQERIAGSLTAVDHKIDVEVKGAATHRELFRTMLHLLMTGQVRVKEFAPPQAVEAAS